MIFYHPKSSSTRKLPKPHPFTDEQVRNKAYQLWVQRGYESSSEENWNDAIQELAREQKLRKVLRPIRRLWWWTGLGRPIQCVWKWTGFQDKKGWDFLQLLIAPILIAGVGFGLQESVKQRDTQQQKAEKERQESIAEDKAKEDTLNKYLDQMEDLLKAGLLNINMRSKNPYKSYHSEQFIIAQIKTVVAIESLDRNRQQLVIQFIEASGFNNTSNKTDPKNPTEWGKTDRVLLYNAKMRKANLAGSDLSGTALVRVYLTDANLGCDKNGQCSNLSSSDLRGADLTNAILTGANLRDADLTNAFLTGANLRETDFRDADLSNTDIKDANFSGAKNLTIAQVKQAKNWKKAHYSPEFCKQLGLPLEQQKL
ncbi:MAG: pentapeptide repeat-containing protein [Nostoc sp.]